jgi:hypothetical protein
MIKTIFALSLLTGCSPGTWLDFIRGEEQVAEKIIMDEFPQPIPLPPPTVTVVTAK